MDERWLMKNNLIGLKTFSKISQRIFTLKLRPLFFLLFALLLASESFAQVTFNSGCASGNPAPGASQTQQLVAEGVGLQETVVGGSCGSALTVTLPAGAVPVTAYLYVEYDY